jgi:hypothetical protein
LGGITGKMYIKILDNGMKEGKYLKELQYRIRTLMPMLNRVRREVREEREK